LPPNWHEGGLILEKLSGAGAPSQYRREITILVWVKIKCPSLQCSMLKEYHQFSLNSTFTYGQLLDRYLDKAVNLGLQLENNKAPLMQQKVNVFLYTSLEETRKRLCATVRTGTSLPAYRNINYCSGRTPCCTLAPTDCLRKFSSPVTG
jgi:hypothetical protein